MNTNTGHPDPTTGPMNPAETGAISEMERLARVGLCAVTEPRDPVVTALRARYTITDLWDGLRSADLHVPGVGARALTETDPIQILEQADRLGIRAIVPGDGDWPVGLAGRLGPAAPLVLWIRSQTTLRKLAPAVAVTGARAATQYGEYVAAEMAAGLARHGWVVWSGGAYGCDARAHRGALAEGGTTVALLACGLGQVYPRGHGQLFEDIVARGGALVSELIPYATPSRRRFLERSRLLARFARGLVVIEASRTSSTFSTATQAAADGTPVLAVPGPVTSGLSAGCHELIRTGVAQLVSDADDVRAALAAPPPATPPTS